MPAVLPPCGDDEPAATRGDRALDAGRDPDDEADRAPAELTATLGPEQRSRLLQDIGAPAG